MWVRKGFEIVMVNLRARKAVYGLGQRKDGKV